MFTQSNTECVKTVLKKRSFLSKMTDKQLAAGYDAGFTEGYRVGVQDGYARGYDDGTEQMAAELRG